MERLRGLRRRQGSARLPVGDGIVAKESRGPAAADLRDGDRRADALPVDRDGSVGNARRLTFDDASAVEDPELERTSAEPSRDPGCSREITIRRTQ